MIIYSIIQRRLLRHCDRVCSLLQLDMTGTFSVEEDLHSGLHLLGVLYQTQGKTRKADEMYLRGVSRTWEGWRIWTSIHFGYGEQSRKLVFRSRQDERSRRHVQQALARFEKALGPENRSTLGTVKNLGLLYSAQGKMREAEDMYTRALAGMEKAWGPEDKTTLDTRYN